MLKSDRVFARLSKICLALPETSVRLTWGEPHFRVGEKIFSGYGQEDGVFRAGFKLEMDHAAAIVSDPRFRRARYVGHKGWVSMDLSGAVDWSLVEALVRESYSLIAPKKLVARLDEAAPTAKPRQAKSVATRRPSVRAKKR